jgi:hypothetical protein
MTVVDFDRARLERATKKTGTPRVLTQTKTDLVVVQNEVSHQRPPVPWLLLLAAVSLALSFGCAVVGIAEYAITEHTDTNFQRAGLIFFSVGVPALSFYLFRGLFGE